MSTLAPSLLAGAITILLLTIAWLAIRDCLNPRRT
jgi:hypothetical protein